MKWAGCVRKRYHTNRALDWRDWESHRRPQDSRSPSRDLNLGPVEYEAGRLPTIPQSSLYCSMKTEECRVKPQSGKGNTKPRFEPDSHICETCLRYLVQIHINSSLCICVDCTLLKGYSQKGHVSHLFTELVCREYSAVPFPSVSQQNR